MFADAAGTEERTLKPGYRLRRRKEEMHCGMRMYLSSGLQEAVLGSVWQPAQQKPCRAFR